LRLACDVTTSESPDRQPRLGRSQGGSMFDRAAKLGHGEAPGAPDQKFYPRTSEPRGILKIDH
jgi:hypothetical protein